MHNMHTCLHLWSDVALVQAGGDGDGQWYILGHNEQDPYSETYSETQTAGSALKTLPGQFTPPAPDQMTYRLEYDPSSSWSITYRLEYDL